MNKESQLTLRRMAVALAVGAIGLIFVGSLPLKQNIQQTSYMLGLLPLVGLATYTVLRMKV